MGAACFVFSKKLHTQTENESFWVVSHSFDTFLPGSTARGTPVGSCRSSPRGSKPCRQRLNATALKFTRRDTPIPRGGNVSLSTCRLALKNSSELSRIGEFT